MHSLIASGDGSDRGRGRSRISGRGRGSGRGNRFLWDPVGGGGAALTLERDNRKRGGIPPNRTASLAPPTPPYSPPHSPPRPLHTMCRLQPANRPAFGLVSSSCYPPRSLRPPRPPRPPAPSRALPRPPASYSPSAPCLCHHRSDPNRSFTHQMCQTRTRSPYRPQYHTSAAISSLPKA